MKRVFAWRAILVLLSVAHSEKAYNGQCSNQSRDPVCGTNGVTYDNLCQLESKQVSDLELKLSYNGICVLEKISLRASKKKKKKGSKKTILKPPQKKESLPLTCIICALFSYSGPSNQIQNHNYVGNHYYYNQRQNPRRPRPRPRQRPRRPRFEDYYYYYYDE